MIYTTRNPYTGRRLVVLGWRGFLDLFWYTPRPGAGLRNSSLIVGCHLFGRLFTADIVRRP